MSKIKSEMPLFIQGMYATVLGVSFYKIALQDTDAWRPVDNFTEAWFFITHLWLFISSVFFFKFLLFGFTLLILAHDWQSYHTEKINEKEEFWLHIPQIFSLFFLAQLFASVEKLNLRYWYVFGFCYTIANVFNVWLTYPTDLRIYKWIKYSIHTSIIITFLLILPVPKQYKDGEVCSLIAITITAFVVIALWQPKANKCIDKLRRAFTKNTNNAPENTVEGAEEKAIAAAETEAKTAREEYLSAIKFEIEEAKITAAEEKITTAEGKAKEERKKIIDKLATAEKEIKDLKQQLENKPNVNINSN